MKIIFAGTPDFAAAHLQSLIDAKFDIVATYTQPDRPAGRGKKLTPSAVKKLAIQHNIPVEQPLNFKNDDAIEILASYNADVMIVVAYGLILPKNVLQTPRFGCLNVHGSILPKWRGAAPIQRSLWAGNDETGVTIMQMDEGLDTGDILSIERIAITPDDTSATLYRKLAEIGPQALITTLNKLDSITPIKQDDEQATYAKKLSKEEAKLDWDLSATQLERNVRAFNPWPVAWFSWNDKNIKVWGATVVDSEGENGTIVDFSKLGLTVTCGKGALRITSFQLPNKKPQSVNDIYNGNSTLFTSGDKLT
ncbi:MAG: methionyl-tRNA formyltransferase [Pseudomonadota bacterium]